MKSYFKFLSRNKLYTFINIAGLVVSLMFIILMGDYTWRQYSIDSWHKNADRIYLTGNQEMFFMWPQAAQEIEAMCPEVESSCCVMSQNGRIKYGQQEVKNSEGENGIIMLADSTFFRFFDFPLVEGDPRTALNAPDRCVITERLAKRLFGDKNPMGESLQIVGERNVYLVRPDEADPYDSTQVYTISAVAKDFDRTVLPNETQIIASMERFPEVMGYKLSNDAFAYASTGPCKAFLMLKPGFTFDAKKQIVEDHLSKNYSQWDRNGKSELTMTPMTDIMFASQNNGSGMMKGDKTRLRILLAAVLAILFFAVSNYINLTVANTGFRAKEMATRRLFGSSQREISLKLIAESTLMVAVSFVIGFVLAFCFQDDAAELFKGKIALTNDINVGTVSISIAFILLVGIISGIMPSWQISRFQPIDIVKGTFRFHSKMVLGKAFIILQNVITFVMLTAAFVIWLQLNHLIHAPLGFNTENLYYIHTPQGKGQTVRGQLEKMPFVEGIGSVYNTSFTGYSSSMRTIKAGEKKVSLLLSDMDSTAFKLFGLELLKDNGPTSDGCYLNEEAMRQFEYTNDVKDMDWGEGEKRPIAGVVKDFHRINVLRDLEPFCIRLREKLDDLGLGVSFVVKTNGDKQAKTAFTDMILGLGVPAADAHWYCDNLQDEIAETFEDQQNTLKIITLFTFVAVVISIMGFVGMSLFFIRQRKKEIGIRKIMGSSSSEVLVLMLRTFCAPLLVSFVIAIPLAARSVPRCWYRLSLPYPSPGISCAIG